MGLQCRHYKKIKESIHISWSIFDFCQYHLLNINEWNIDFSLQLIDDIKQDFFFINLGYTDA